VAAAQLLGGAQGQQLELVERLDGEGVGALDAAEQAGRPAALDRGVAVGAGGDADGGRRSVLARGGDVVGLGVAGVEDGVGDRGVADRRVGALPQLPDAERDGRAESGGFDEELSHDGRASLAQLARAMHRTGAGAGA
jgi:hypothetical protein